MNDPHAAGVTGRLNASRWWRRLRLPRIRRHDQGHTKPRVLFCALNYAPGASGGAERQAQLQAEELARRGYEVAVVCPRQPGLCGGWLNGVRVHRLPVRWAGRGRRPMHFMGLVAFLLTHLHRYDLVHVHLAGLQTEAAVPVARLFRRPVYVKLAAGGPRGDVLRYFSLPGLPRRLGLRHATRLQVITQQIADDLRHVGIPETRTVRIPNGVRLSRFRPPSVEERASLRSALGLPEDAVVVLYTGRLEPQKGVVDLVTVWPELHAEAGAVLLLVGGSTDSSLDAAALRAGGVEVRGWATRIEDYYQAADAFVLASHSEGMSNAMLEAMASGLPVVSSRVGAAEELLDGGRVGLLYEPRDRPALRDALRTLVLDPGLRRRLGQASEQHVRRYAIETVVDQIEREYAGLIGCPALAADARTGPPADARLDR